METYDLYNLQDDVLFKPSESFHNFVINVCGKVEADIFRIQGIRNARCLIRSTNLLSMLELDCEEVNLLKPDACFQSKSGDLIVRQGVKLNLDNLFDAVKEKHEKYRNRKQRRQLELSSTAAPSPTVASNINENTSSNTQVSTEQATTITSSDSSLLTATTVNVNTSHAKYASMDDHITFIQDLIEKFSRKTFVSIILKRNEHYELMVSQDEQGFKAVIKCRCGTKIMLSLRSDTSTFILSNFYAHLTASNCSIVDRIMIGEKAGNEESETQSTSASVQQPPTTISNDSSSN